MTTPADDRLEQMYRLRARRLADRRAAKVEATTVAVLAVWLGSERYAIELSDLAEVIAYRGSTSVPGAPPALLGVINVRGDIRAVADLGRLLDLPKSADESAGYVLMLRQKGRTVGFRVDGIDQVRHIDPALVKVTADGGTAPGGARFVRGLTPDGIMWLDTNAAMANLGGRND